MKRKLTSQTEPDRLNELSGIHSEVSIPTPSECDEREEDEFSSDQAVCPFCGAVNDNCVHLLAHIGSDEYEFGGGYIWDYQRRLFKFLIADEEDDDDCYAARNTIVDLLMDDPEIEYKSYFVDEATGIYEYTSFWSKDPALTLSRLVSQIEGTA